MLWMFQRVFTGVPEGENAKLRDVSIREIVVVAPLLAISLFIGIYPKPVIDRVEPTVERVIANFKEKTDYKQPKRTASTTSPARGAYDGVPAMIAADDPDARRQLGRDRTGRQPGRRRAHHHHAQGGVPPRRAGCTTRRSRSRSPASPPRGSSCGACGTSIHDTGAYLTLARWWRSTGSRCSSAPSCSPPRCSRCCSRASTSSAAASRRVPSTSRCCCSRRPACS